MDKALEVLLQQSPSLAGLVLIAIGLWVVFKRNLQENKLTHNSLKGLFDQHKDNVNEILVKYKEMLEIQKAEIDRHRVNFSALLDDKARLDKRYDETKKEFSEIFIENRNLKRTLDNIEEMLKATGGDVKYIQKELLEQRKDIEDLNVKIGIEDMRGREDIA